MTFPDTLPPVQRRRHLADRRKVQERITQERRRVVRRQCKELAK